MIAIDITLDNVSGLEVVRAALSSLAWLYVFAAYREADMAARYAPRLGDRYARATLGREVRIERLLLVWASSLILIDVISMLNPPGRAGPYSVTAIIFSAVMIGQEATILYTKIRNREDRQFILADVRRRMMAAGKDPNGPADSMTPAEWRLWLSDEADAEDARQADAARSPE